MHACIQMVSIRLSVGIVACVLSAIVCMLAWQRARHQATEGESYCHGGICMRSTEGSNTWNSLCSPTHRKNASCEILVYWHDSSLRKHNKRRHPSNKFLGLKLLPSPQALASVTMHIPRRIAQTGPPKRKTWATGFAKAFGSWQKQHPTWTYWFWDDDWDWPLDNPNLEPFVLRHFPYFAPAWRQLCTRIMRFDVARAMWLYVRA